MKEEHIWTKKPETMLDWFCVVGACIALYLTLNNLGYFLGKIGVFIGIVFGAKLISALMKRYSLLVYSAIMGLVIGSLYAVFPDGFGFNLETLAGVAALIVGGAIAVLVGKNTEVEQQ